MSDIKISKIIIRIGLFIYVIGNIYFGWNKIPMSDLELMFDNVTQIILLSGVIIYLSPLIELYENTIKKYNKD